MSYNMTSAASFMKSQKEREFSRDRDNADLGPHIIVEKDGNPAAIFMAPKTTTKIQACKAAMVCKVGFDPDSITMGFDAIITNVDDESERECLVLQKIDRQKNIEITVMPYQVDQDKNLVWEENLEDEIGSPTKVFGDVVNKLKKIMAISSDEFSIENVLNEVISSEEMSREQFLFHTSRAAMSVLMGMGFKIIDLISYKHPEWTNAKENGEKIIDKMIESEVVAEEHKEKLLNIVKNHIGQITFKEKFEHQLVVSNVKMPQNMKLFTFVQIFEQMCIQPKFCDSFLETFNKNNED